MRRLLRDVALVAACSTSIGLAAEGPTCAEARAGLQQAVKFFRSSAGFAGGYVHRVAADLSQRAGEEKVGSTTAWIEPPATPAVGQAYLDAFEACGEPILLAAAVEAGLALVRGQLQSGGWGERIEFAPADRRSYAYRTDGDEVGTRDNTTTFDDDKSQSCLRFLLALAARLERQKPVPEEAVRIREAAAYALDQFAAAQFPNGNWPQKWRGSRRADPAMGPDANGEFPRARIPTDWPRIWSKASYSDLSTLNDGLMQDMITTFLAAHAGTGDDRWLAVAKRGGDFLLRAQLPEPQPAWAQQYDRQMQPAWARRFEPPAVSGGESQGVLLALILLARRTGDDRYLAAVRPAIAYLERSRLPDGRLARFYELGTNRPLFMTRDYALTYEDDDLPTHYGFKVDAKLDAIAKALADIHAAEPASRPPGMANLGPRVRGLLAALDDRGGWVEQGSLPGGDGRVALLDSRTFIKNLATLAAFVGDCGERLQTPATNGDDSRLSR